MFSKNENDIKNDFMHAARDLGIQKFDMFGILFSLYFGKCSQKGKCQSFIACVKTRQNLSRRARYLSFFFFRCCTFMFCVLVNQF